jgi:hypothetical protein
MACPRCVSDPCGHRSGSPAATAICARTKVHARDLLGDRMLDLEPRVHFEEIERCGIARSLDQELHGSGVAVAGGASQLDRGISHAPP